MRSQGGVECQGGQEEKEGVAEVARPRPRPAHRQPRLLPPLLLGPSRRFCQSRQFLVEVLYN